jgi:DNA-binding NarL/FixJ family response regulator
MAHEQILIVEDQRAVAGALKLRLRGLGYDVSAIAKDGFEAIEKASELKPDLILMDVRLGDGIDGIETAQRIRARHDIPVVFISAYVDQKLLERARATRPAGFINKPFTTKDLLTAIDLALHCAPANLDLADIGTATGADDRPKDGVITADSEGRVGFIDQAAEYIISWHRRQVVGRPLADLLAVLYDVPLAQATALVSRVLENGSEESITRPLGGRFGGNQTTIDTLTPLHDSRGQVYGVALKLSAGLGSDAKRESPRHDHALSKALDAVPHGVLVVNSELRIRYLNRTARDTLSRNRGIEFRNDTLGIVDKLLDQRLRELVQLAVSKAQQGHDQASGAMFVRSPMSREHIELIVAPVPETSVGNAETSVLIYLFDANSPRQVSYDVLTGLYGLTQSEAKLAQLMTNGMTLDDAADELEISVNTARTHLKHIFHKTGINRQTELLHRIESGPASLLIGFTGSQLSDTTPRR